MRCQRMPTSSGPVSILSTSPTARRTESIPSAPSSRNAPAAWAAMLLERASPDLSGEFFCPLHPKSVAPALERRGVRIVVEHLTEFRARLVRLALGQMEL